MDPLRQPESSRSLDAGCNNCWRQANLKATRMKQGGGLPINGVFMNCVLSARPRRSYRSGEIGWRKRGRLWKRSKPFSENWEGLREGWNFRLLLARPLWNNSSGSRSGRIGNGNGLSRNAWRDKRRRRRLNNFGRG